MMINIAVVGGRNFKDYALMKKVLTDFIGDDKMVGNIVSGGATGADTLAEKFAAEMNYEMLVFRPDRAKYGRAAPLMRNTQIIENADVVFAFWDGISRGTMDSINKAKKLQRELHVVSY